MPRKLGKIAPSLFAGIEKSTKMTPPYMMTCHDMRVLTDVRNPYPRPDGLPAGDDVSRYLGKIIRCHQAAEQDKQKGHRRQNDYYVTSTCGRPWSHVS